MELQDDGKKVVFSDEDIAVLWDGVEPEMERGEFSVMLWAYMSSTERKYRRMLLVGSLLEPSQLAEANKLEGVADYCANLANELSLYELENGQLPPPPTQ